MLCRLALVGTALGLIACTSLPPPPGVGAGGAGGSVGGGGNTGMDGGTGTGGADGCSSVTFGRTPDLEGDDGVTSDAAVGTVAEGADRTDRWAIDGCGGDHDFRLSWGEMGQGLVLDLVVLDSDEQLVDAEMTVQEAGEKELIGVNLPAGEEFFVEVQAVDTSGVNFLSYTLTVAVD